MVLDDPILQEHGCCTREQAHSSMIALDGFPLLADNELAAHLVPF